MIIGILQCDSIRSEYRDRFDNYPEMFRRLIRQVAPEIETIVYDVEHHEYPNNIEVCDAYITTGSKASVYENHAWIQALQTFIRRLFEQDKKLVAICFGHQLVAQTLGGKTMKSDRGWGVGVHTMNMQVNKSWMLPGKDQVNVLVSHQDQVVELPTGAELIASNDFCPNSMYTVNQNILSIQGHPEFSADYAGTMMETRREQIGETAYSTALASFENSTDELLLIRWILQFCGYKFA